MRELLYEAAKHYRQGTTLMEQGDRAGAAASFGLALRELQAVRPQRNRDVLLAQVYLSRHQLDPRASQAASDLRMGYAYARTTAEPHVRALAEKLWLHAIEQGWHVAPTGSHARPRSAARSDGSARVDGANRNDARPAGAGEGRAGRSRRGRGKRGGRNSGSSSGGGGNPAGGSS